MQERLISCHTCWQTQQASVAFNTPEAWILCCQHTDKRQLCCCCLTQQPLQ